MSYVDRTALLARAGSIVGPNRVLVESTDMDGYQRDWKGRDKGNLMDPGKILRTT